VRSRSRSAQRSPLEPALPTMAESGVPATRCRLAGTLRRRRHAAGHRWARLQAEVAKVLRLAEVRERLAAPARSRSASTPQEFGAFVRAENARWSRVIREKWIRSE